MTIKQSPIESPMFYYHIAQATYSKNPNAYMRKAMGSERVHTCDGDKWVETKWASRTWLIRLFEDTVSGELIVGFRGSANLANWLEDGIIISTIDSSKKDKTIKSMEEIVEKWQKAKGRSIWTFVGHSAGGYFATHVKKDWGVFRITFNGLKCERGGGGGESKTINLLIREEKLASNFSIIDRYIVIKLPIHRSALHSLDCFAWIFARSITAITDEWVKHPHNETLVKSWSDVAPEHFIRSKL